MDLFTEIITTLENFVWEFGIPVGDETIPFIVILLIGVGTYLTLRYGFIQIRRFWHGTAVATGRYDDPNEPGDVSHFAALTTALSATVGIGNIAGVALAIHWGGPGALFWMWMTAFLGMCTKFTEVTLAQNYREVKERDPDQPAWEGTVAGGPFYYIERGLGSDWKWMAVLSAVLIATVGFFTGNAAQANTIADTVLAQFGISPWITGFVVAAIVGAVILGGITRIGAVTSRLVPFMGALYVLGGMTVLILNYEEILPTLGLVISEAMNPTAGVAGTGVGAFLVTLMWGAKRGLFSNEAGMGSAPIAHSAAQTDEPVSEGVVALLEPFIDTIVICTMTGLVILMTGVWNTPQPTEIRFGAGAISYIVEEEDGEIIREGVVVPDEFEVENGVPVVKPAGGPVLAWNQVAVQRFYVGPEREQPFTGVIYPERDVAVSVTGETYTALYADAIETGAPLTMLGFEEGLDEIIPWGEYIVLLAVFLFAISTAISWSYYGNRAAYYLWGEKAVLPYNAVFVLINFVGAVLPLTIIWSIGDIFLGLVIIPNLIALVLLSGKVDEIRKSYFQREPWHENREAHLRWKREQEREKQRR